MPAVLSARSAALSAGLASQAPAPDDDLAWDEDELETQIYDTPEEEAAARARRKNGHGKASAVAMPEPPALEPLPANEPDLSSLITTGKSWDGPPVRRTPTDMPSVGGPAPARLPAAPKNGASKGRAHDDAVPTARDVATTQRVSPLALLTESKIEAAGFGAAITAKKSKTALYAGLAAAVLLVGGAAVAVKAITGGNPSAEAASTDVGSAPPAPAAASSSVADDTGFDLYVTPANVAGWRLDSEVRTGRLPAQVRRMSAGPHTIAIDAPPGFMSHTQEVVVETGKAQRITIELTPIDIVGKFDSSPAGADVFLVAGGQRVSVGKTPTQASLDPRLSYQVVFEKDGYVAQSKPIVISGNPEEKVSIVLDLGSAESAGASAPRGMAQAPSSSSRVGRQAPPRTAPARTPAPVKPADPAPVAPAPTPVRPPERPPQVPPESPTKDEGTLRLGSKPPCEIYVDGKNTGLKTPQSEIKLSAGRHKVTLINNEFGIKESFSIEIRSGEETLAVKDYSDRLQP